MNVAHSGDSHPARSASLLRIHLVARKTMTYRYFLWDWGEAIATEGLLAATAATGEPEYYRWVTRKIDQWIDRSPEPFWPDHVGPGVALIEYCRHSGQAHLLRYARMLAAHLEGLPRARTGARLHRPDKGDIARLVWVDSMQTDAPFLCALGQVTGEIRYYDQAADHLAGQVVTLQDEREGLFYHNYSDETGQTNGVFWGRGNGWAALGLAATLARLPAEHPRREWLAERFRVQVGALLKHQDASGGWHTVLDRRRTPLETSATLMVAHALALGNQAGVLGEEVQASMDRAWAGVGQALDASGVVQGVSERTPPRQDAESYERRSHRGPHAWPWGQGPWLLEACRRFSEGKAAFSGQQSAISPGARPVPPEAER